MLRVIIFSLLTISILSVNSFAQLKTSRFTKQHRVYFIKEHMDQTENMLLQSLQSNDANMVSFNSDNKRA